MSQQKVEAEKQCRRFKESVENLSESLKQERSHVRALEEALSAEEARHQQTKLSTNNENERLEKLIQSIKSEAATEMTGLDRSRGQVTILSQECLTLAPSGRDVYAIGSK